MKKIILLLFLLVPAFLFAQYPATGNKSRLGYQTTGDGLIWRGIAADTAIKPRTTANAYFQLDTVNRILRRYIATQGSWQVVGSGTNVDSLIYATRYWVGANFFPLVGGTLTGTGGAGFLGLPAQSGTPSTPASGFRLFANGAHNLAILDRNGWITTFDISATANRDFTYPSTGGTFALGTGIADRSARWSATNTLAAGNITDNGTKLQALLPWQFQTYTTAGLPTGVTGYTVYNTTLNGIGWYDGSRWNYVPKADRSAFTATYVPYTDANGQLTQSANLTFASNQLKVIGSNTTSGTQNFVLQNSAGDAVFRVDNAGAIQQFGPSISFSGYSAGAIVYRLYSGGNTDNPLLFDVRNGARGSAYGSFTLNADFNSNAYIGGGIFFDTRDGVAPLRFLAKDNSTNPVDAMDIFDIATVGIGTNNTPINSAQLAVNSTTRGFLPPRWTAAQRAVLSGPATGLIGYQTDGTEGLYVKQASAFKRLLWEGDEAWLKTKLEAGTDVDITGVSSTDFRIRNTRIQFDRRLKIGTDSSFVYDANADTLFIMGDGVIKGITVTPFKFLGPNNTSGNFKSQISLGDWESSRGWNIGVDANEAGVNNMYFYNNETGALPFALVGKTVLVGNADLTVPSGLSTDMHVRATLTDGFVVSNSALTRRWTNTGSILKGLKVGGITSFTKDVNADTLYNYGAIQLDALGTGTATTVLGKTSTNEIVPVEIKRDTTIFLSADTDYDFSAAVTTAQIASRYNRVIIHMTLTSGVGADKTTTLHTPDANLMQCEILIRGTDNTGTYDNEINFGTNNAISSDGTNASGYTLAQGQGLHVRVVYNGSAYKYIYY